MISYTTKKFLSHRTLKTYWYEYRQEGDVIAKYRCIRQPIMNERKVDQNESEEFYCSWNIDDPTMPDWLRRHIKQNSYK